uniref:Myb/SANT-like domain-containing protein n=1 Tax=Setaria italica TaxID=4555 RepID=K3Y008_SETIT
MNNRASWDEGTTKTLLDLSIAQKNQLNWSDKCLTKLGWRNVYSCFRAQTGLQLGSKQLQNKLNNMRRAFLGWLALQNKSGLGRDTQNWWCVCLCHLLGAGPTGHPGEVPVEFCEASTFPRRVI